MSGDFSLQAALTTALIGGIAGYAASVLNQDRTRRLERKTFTRALQAEISILAEKVAENDFLREVGERGGGAVCNREGDPMVITERDMIVFSTNTSKVGLYDDETATHIIHFYQAAHVARLKLEEWYRLGDIDDGIARPPYVRENVPAAVSLGLGLADRLSDKFCPWHIALHVWAWHTRELFLQRIGWRQGDPNLPRLRGGWIVRP